MCEERDEGRGCACLAAALLAAVLAWRLCLLGGGVLAYLCVSPKAMLATLIRLISSVIVFFWKTSERSKKSSSFATWLVLPSPIKCGKSVFAKPVYQGEADMTAVYG